MFNLHIKQTEISQKRSKEMKNCKGCFFVILRLLNKLNFRFIDTLTKKSTITSTLVNIQAYRCCTNVRHSEINGIVA